MDDHIPVKTAETMFEIVEVILDRDGARFSSLRDDLGMPKSTLYDHLESMVSLGLLSKQDSEYRVSTTFLSLGEAVRQQRDIYLAATDEVKKLAIETGEHASLLVEEDGEGVLLDVQKGEDAVDINAYPGRRLPITPHAPGKAILAHLPDERVAEILDEHGLPRYTEQTIVDRDALLEELERVRSRGYAVDDEELIEGIKAVSIPIRTEGRVCGAITVGGPMNRMGVERVENELLDLLLESANIVELSLSVGNFR